MSVSNYLVLHFSVMALMITGKIFWDNFRHGYCDGEEISSWFALSLVWPVVLPCLVVVLLFTGLGRLARGLGGHGWGPLEKDEYLHDRS